MGMVNICGEAIFSHEPGMAVPIITILITQSGFKDSMNNDISKLQNLMPIQCFIKHSSILFLLF